MLTRKETSELLKISIATLIRMEKKGILTPVKYFGEKSKVFYNKSEVESLMNNENSNVAS